MADKKTASKKAVSAPKKLKFADYKAMNTKELEQKITEAKKELAILSYNSKLGDVQNVRAKKFQKRNLARLYTALNQSLAIKEEK